MSTPPNWSCSAARAPQTSRSTDWAGILYLFAIVSVGSACIENQHAFTPRGESVGKTSGALLCRPSSWAPPSPMPGSTGPLETIPPEPTKPFAIALNGEGGSFRCDEVDRQSCASGFTYTEAGRNYILSERPAVIGDQRPHRHPTEMITNCGMSSSSTQACAADSAARGLLIEGFDHADFVDRMEINLSQSGGAATDVLQFGEWRYLRFFMKLKAGFSLSTTTMQIPASPPCSEQTITFAQGLLITQVWQRDSSEYNNGVRTRPSVGPAFTIQLTMDDDPTRTDDPPPLPGYVYAQFLYRNDAISEEDVSNDPVGASCLYYGACKKFWTSLVPIDQWIGYAIAMKPAFMPTNGTTDPQARGTILLWRINPGAGLAFPLGGTLPLTSALNYNSQDDSSYRFYWGFRPEVPFQPASTPDYRGGFTDRFDVRIGQYGDSHAHSPILFDAVKLTNHEQCLPSTFTNVGPCGGA
jgi:hypothetical protein